MADTHVTSGFITVGSGLAAVGSGMNVIVGNFPSTSISGNVVNISGQSVQTSVSGNVVQLASQSPSPPSTTFTFTGTAFTMPFNTSGGVDLPTTQQFSGGIQVAFVANSGVTLQSAGNVWYGISGYMYLTNQYFAPTNIELNSGVFPVAVFWDSVSPIAPYVSGITPPGVGIIQNSLGKNIYPFTSTSGVKFCSNAVSGALTFWYGGFI